MYGLRPATSLTGALDRGTAADLYRVMRAYYESNNLYDALADLLRRQGISREAIKPLRNPTYRVVEFYPSHLWPGTLPDALPIMADKKRVIEPIEQVWKWSNWGAQKQVAARQLALYGDFFIKVATTPAEAPQRVYLQMIEPEYVTDFDVDERGYVIYCRVDTPRRRRRADGSNEPYIHTEEWSRDENRFRVWEHQQSATVEIDQLGTPTVDVPITSFGIDFVPISHAKFADIGDLRGQPAILPSLDKIDEANRSVTRLHQQLWRHNDVTWALNGGVDGSGKPLPPPLVSGSDATTNENGYITFGEEQFVALPGNTELKSLVPDLNYAAALSILQDHMGELEQDLPELAWYRMRDNDLSGRAVRLLLAPAIARLEEARGNAEAALVRADEMALTIGKYHRLFRDSIGAYDRGDFEHAFEKRDVLPDDALERAQEQLANGTALKAYVEAGMSMEMAVQEVLGWTPEKAAQFSVENLAAKDREAPEPEPMPVVVQPETVPAERL